MSVATAPFVRARIAASRRPPVTVAASAAAEQLDTPGSGARLASVLALIEIALATTGFGDQAIAMAAVILYVVGLLIAAVRQPRVALYALVGTTLFFEAYSRDPLMAAGTLLNRNMQAQFNLPGVQFTPLEIVQLVTLLVVLVGGGSRGARLRGGALVAPAMLFLGMVFSGLTRGVLGGGLVNYAIWEMRFVVSMIVCYVLAANTIRSRGDVRELLAVFFVFGALFGVEGVIRRHVFIASGMLGETQEIWYSHEDVVIWAAFMLLVLAQQIFGAPRWQRILGPPLAVVTSYALLVSERRAGIISVIVAFLVLAVTLFMAHRKAFFLIVVPMLICGAVYIPVFWNASGALAQPARAIKSINDPDPRDAQSNMWRVLELINIRATIASDPLTGVGFGRPYTLVVAIPDISFFDLWQYETHHNILWIWLKTGVIGFLAFWCLLGTGMARAANHLRRRREPELRVFAALTLIGIVSSIVYSYVDLGLAGSRVPMFLGVMLGGISVLDRLNVVDAKRAVGPQARQPILNRPQT